MVKTLLLVFTIAVTLFTTSSGHPRGRRQLFFSAHCLTEIVTKGGSLPQIISYPRQAVEATTMAREVTAQTRQELVSAVRERYRVSSREEKALFVNFFQPSFKLAEKTRVGARVSKRYHAPQTPCPRLLTSGAVSEQVKARLREIAQTLDPLQLLDEIRKMQHHLVALADGGQPYTPPQAPEELARFLASLSTAWRTGEVRPTHCTKPKPPRHWRTRKDPFESVWSEICRWLEAEPDQTGLHLFQRLQGTYPGVFPDGQLRTLQRRLKDWRTQAARRLVFGVQHDTFKTVDPGKISSEAASKILI